MKVTEKKADLRCILGNYFIECTEDLNVSSERKSKKTRITPWLKKCFRICS